MINSKYGYSGTMHVSTKNNTRKLYKHQEDAIKALIKTNKKEHHKGLLVIPTGGGKTFTAVYYLLNQMINNKKKVLWIAHRHELLNQTLETVDKASFKDVVPDRKSFRYRIISGKHDRPVNIKKDDDIIIASKDSLVRGKEYIEKWIIENKDNVCLVIDEAHHAVAKTYRTIVNMIEEHSEKWSKILGLTATPIRTSEAEKGLLKKIFRDDIIYSIDLNTLISKGILAKPYFSEKNTQFTLKKELTSKELDYIKRSGKLPENIAIDIVKNSERNNVIVDEYVKNKDMYGKTLVFAINIVHAIELNALFNKNGVRSDYVISSLKDAGTGVTISSEENERKIKSFRTGELDVLINVNILTEGTDIPNIQTIFLTRQTTSKILLNQMIGRGLRGVNAGGTEHANIVSFIDNWKYRINWISPRQLDVFDENDFKDGDSVRRKYEERSILVKLIEDFTIETYERIEKVEELKYSGKFAAVGGYKFTLISEDEDRDDKDCTIIVFDNLKSAYSEFLLNMNHIFNELNLYVDINKEKIQEAVRFVKDIYFSGYDLFGFNEEDIEDLLMYYYSEEVIPKFTKLETPVVPNNQPQIGNEPKVEIDEYKFEDLSLAEIKKIDPKYWRKLRDEVFEKFKEENGFYVSATGLYKSESKWFFQIDHIKPISKGGKTVLDNLQLLARWENKIKGNKDITIDELKVLLDETIDELLITDLEEQLIYTYFDKGDIECSKELIKKIQNVDSENLLAYSIIADIKIYEQKYTAALINANKALKINQNDYLSMYVKGEAYYYKENYKEAIKWLEMALRELKEDDVLIYKYLGDSYFNLKKKDIALTYYLKVTEISCEKNEFIGDVEFMIGEIYFSKRKYETSKEHYLKSLECNDTVPETYNNIGVCCERLNNLGEALEYYYNAYERDSRSKLYLNNIRRLKKIKH